MATTQVNPEIAALEAELKKAAEKPAPTLGTQPATIELNLAGGQVFKGTQEEVLKKLADAQNNATITLAQRKQEIEDLRTQIAAKSAPVSEGTTGYDRNEYYRLWEKDPVEAQNYLDGHRFSMAPGQVVSAITSTYEIGQKVNDQMEVARFLSTAEDFPGGPEASEKLLRHLDTSGRTVTSENLFLSYHELKQAGHIQATDANITATQARNMPPPSLNGSGGGSSAADIDMARQAEALTTDQLEAALRKHGFLK